jgi:GTP-binding protein EngB required for normal cell division
MGKHAVVVVGPAGSGKSTFCRTLFEHYTIMKKSTHVCNFDPAAEDLCYEPSVDIRELICVDDVTEAKGLGPNGGLVYAMEYLMQHAGWITDQLADYADDFLIVDMPGQIELLTHIPVVPSFIELLRQQGYFVTAVFLLDAPTVTSDTGKYVSGCLLALTTMVSLDCPFINVLSKCDLLPPNKKRPNVLVHYENCDFDYMSLEQMPATWRSMTRQVATIVNDFSLVKFVPLDITDEDAIRYVANLLNDTLQVDDDAEVRDNFGDEPQDGE